MQEFIQQGSYVFVKLVDTVLLILQITMFARAILSWLPGSEDNKFIRFINALTEPVIYPVRTLLNRLNLFKNSPIDAAFFITFMIIILLQLALSQISA